MLEDIRIDRPNQIIHKVISIKKNSYGFFDVKVNMESMFFGTKIKHTHCTLPYPYSEFEKLNRKQQLDWSYNRKYNYGKNNSKISSK